ncbi:hypothetical protein G6F31_021580 [Rhizopus arrhizus]|nr:hypothetical protein G6F31_021580 [Rhizopus arrhizus]
MAHVRQLVAGNPVFAHQVRQAALDGFGRVVRRRGHLEVGELAAVFGQQGEISEGAAHVEADTETALAGEGCGVSQRGSPGCRRTRAPKLG